MFRTNPPTRVPPDISDTSVLAAANQTPYPLSKFFQKESHSKNDRADVLAVKLGRQNYWQRNSRRTRYSTDSIPRPATKWCRLALPERWRSSQMLRSAQLSLILPTSQGWKNL